MWRGCICGLPCPRQSISQSQDGLLCLTKQLVQVQARIQPVSTLDTDFCTARRSFPCYCHPVQCQLSSRPVHPKTMRLFRLICVFLLLVCAQLVVQQRSGRDVARRQHGCRLAVHRWVGVGGGCCVDTLPSRRPAGSRGMNSPPPPKCNCTHQTTPACQTPCKSADFESQ